MDYEWGLKLGPSIVRVKTSQWEDYGLLLCASWEGKHERTKMYGWKIKTMQTKNISPSGNATIYVECRAIRETFATLQLINGVILEEGN